MQLVASEMYLVEGTPEGGGPNYGFFVVAPYGDGSDSSGNIYSDDIKLRGDGFPGDTQLPAFLAALKAVFYNQTYGTGDEVVTFTSATVTQVSSTLTDVTPS